MQCSSCNHILHITYFVSFFKNFQNDKHRKPFISRVPDCKPDIHTVSRIKKICELFVNWFKTEQMRSKNEKRKSDFLFNLKKCGVQPHIQ